MSEKSTLLIEKRVFFLSFPLYNKRKKKGISIMMYCPNIYEEREGSFVLPQNAHVAAHPVLDHPVIKELFLGHAFRLSSLTLSQTDELIFRLGNAATPPLAGEAYAVSVEKDGACVCAKGEKELIWGLMMLLDAALG